MKSSKILGKCVRCGVLTLTGRAQNTPQGAWGWEERENFERGEFCSRRRMILERSSWEVPGVCSRALSNGFEQKPYMFRRA